MGTYPLLYIIELTLVSDGDDRTSFLVSVYKKSRVPFEQDEVTGSLRDTIGGTLAKRKDGTKTLCLTMSRLLTRSSPIKVLKVPLGGGTSDPLERSGITIKFTLAIEAHGDVNATELQAPDAVNRAMEPISVLRPAPRMVGQVDSAIGTGTQATTELQAFENAWDVLLNRMALFNQIVAGIAEVSGIQRRAPSPSECRIDPPIYVFGLVDDIVREAGMCVTRYSHSCLSQIRDDRVIRNLTTGQCIGGPFQGHTRGVNSVAYSPDGSHIVSGSLDKTIRVRNPTTVQCAASPFQGHKANNRFTKAWTPSWARHDFYLPIL